MQQVTTTTSQSAGAAASRAAPSANPSPLFALTNQYQGAFALIAAVKLDLFSPLATQPGSAKEVAAARSLPVRGVERLLNAMAALQVVTKTHGTFALSPAAAEFLVQGQPHYIGSWIAERAKAIQAWARLDEAVLADKPLQAHSDDAVQQMSEADLESYIGGLKQFALTGPAFRLAERLDLQDRHALLDVGGGSGVYSCVLAQKNPQTRFVVMDLAPVLAIAKRTVAEFGLERRVTLWEGDFKKTKFGNGYDAALLSNVLQTEGAAVAKKLIKKVFDALNPGGVVAVHGIMTNKDGAGPAPSVLSGLMFLLFFPEGSAYTTDEYAGWLEAAGFVDVKVERMPTPSVYTLVTARKPNSSTN